MPVPEGPTGADLSRLSALIATYNAERLVILGDLLHAASGLIAEMMDAVGEWRASHKELDVLLIRGNHDAAAGDPPRSWNIRVEDGPWSETEDGAVAFAHEPETVSTLARASSMLCGHIHPAAMLRGRLRDFKAPCFWVQERVLVMPAFGSFTGTRVIVPRSGDRVLVVGEGEVAEVGGARVLGGSGP